MRLIADLHCHFYPCYPLSDALESAVENLRALSPSGEEAPTMALALTERFDCHFFKELLEGRIVLKNWALTQCKEPQAFCLTHPDGSSVIVFAGRQIVTAEKLELLALTSDVSIPDGLSFSEAHQLVSKSGAIPVLNWAPGKWMFSRKPIVQRIIEEFSPNELLICDTTLRPTIWAKPLLMRKAERAGFKIIAGSDPLPFPGEEQRLGTYGIISLHHFNESEPVRSLRELLATPRESFRVIGSRSPAHIAAKRMFVHAAQKNQLQR